MRVLLCIGSRADKAAIEAVYQALLNQKVDAHLIYGFDPPGIEYDMVVLEGDRWEVLEAAVKFYKQKMVIAHLGGGDITEGSQDDCMRHAITKLAHLHFPTNFAAAKRIIQMGEEPWRVKTVGEPGIDVLNYHEKGLATQFAGAEDYLLVVWHPNTLATEDEALLEVEVLANALDQINMNKVVIGPNNDSGAARIASYWHGRSVGTAGTKFVYSLPRDMYLTLLKYAKCLVGNSSSGYYEAPSFGTPVVDVGDRQKGRVKPSNIYPSTIELDNIVEVVKKAMEHQYPVQNPYATANAADEIAKHIAKLGQPGHDPRKLLRKHFYEIKH